MRDTQPHDNVLPFPLTERERSLHTDRLVAIQEPAALADYLHAERTALIERIRGAAPSSSTDGTQPLGGLAMARAFSDLMDAVITHMFVLACERCGANPTTLSIVIVATGGYGRRELSPYSDIDITFIPYRDGDPLIDRVIRDMFTQVMDICITRCGLEVGYAYRLLEDCGTLDHQTLSGLLDARRITGSDRLFIQFEDAFWFNFNATEFIFTKLEERQRALAKWGRTPRVVEPQLKEGPGGLRDLHTAVWLVQARNHLAAARVRGPRAFDALVREADLPQANAERLAEAKERLFQVRNALHALTGAARDELVITRQEDVATALGYESESDSIPDTEEREKGKGKREETASPNAQRPTPNAPPVERFMADLYPALALVRRVADQVMERVANSRLLLGIGLDCKRQHIVPANDALESDDPVWMLWACELAQKYDLQFGASLQRAIVALVGISPILPDPDQAAQVFTRLLSKQGKVYPILQEMANLGILGWYLPEFGALMDLIPYDPSHEYTVGQHSLLVVQNLEALLTMSDEDRAEMRRILEELPNPEQLMLAALLHDSGKALPGRPHAEVSEEIVVAVCARLGWSEEATANVRFLVRQHLLMAETSRLRDLNLDSTLRDFLREVNDLDRLNMLYLLTYADTCAVGAGVWTQVKERFLRDLWRRAAAVLCDEEPADYDDAAVARARRRLLKDLSPENLPEEEVSEHVQAMPSEYLLNQNLRQIALHIGFIRRVRAGETVVDFHDERNATYTEVTICAYDDPQPGLLAKIAGALYAADLNVHSAQVITRVTPTDRIALDTLWVDFRGRPLAPGKRREVTANINAVLTGAKSVQEILSKGHGAARRHAASEPRPLIVRSVRNDLSETLTFIETGGPDASGTFYRVSSALSQLGWDIRSARASAWQGEARASFYVTGARHLSAEAVRATLMEALKNREQGTGNREEKSS